MRLLGREVLARLTGKPRLLFFDVDGTLAPLVRRPEDAEIPKLTLRTLAKLASNESTVVALVSGRGADDARRMLPDVKAWVVGNHGCEVLEPAGSRRIAPLAEPFRERVAAAFRALRERTAHVPGVIIEDKTWTLSLHYRLADPAMEEPLRIICTEVAAQNSLRVMAGKKIHELRPSIAVNKGTAVMELAEALGGMSPGASILFAGDDLTDEDAFVALREANARAVTVRVSEDDPNTVRTAAEWLARGPNELADFLSQLAEG